MKNKHIVHFSMDPTDPEYCIALEVLNRYRMLRLFVIDATQESLEAFLCDDYSKIDLDGVATVLSVRDVQVEQKNIYRYKLSPPENPERFSRSLLVFVVMEPILGGHKRCELYNITVSRSKRGNLVVSVNQFSPQNPKAFSAALTGDISSENAKIILTCALKRPSETVIHSKNHETTNEHFSHVALEDVSGNVTEEVPSPEIPKNPDTHPIEQESVANKHADTLPETVPDKHEEVARDKDFNMPMETELLEENHQFEQFSLSPTNLFDIVSPKIITSPKGKDEEYDALLRENSRLVILLIIFMFLFAIVLIAFLGYVLIVHHSPSTYP